MSRKSKALQFADDTYNITVTGRNVEVTEPMKAYAIEKLSKIEKFSDRILDVHVTMDIQKLDHRVDIVIRVNNIKIKSSASTNDMYASVDLAVNKIVGNLRRFKRKLQNHHARGVKSVDMRVNVFAPHWNDDLQDVNEQIEEENHKELVESFHHPVVSEETRLMKMLTLDEAIMKMELSGDAFLVFQSEEDKSLKVIYRRKDGNFGVIEPELMP